MHHPGLFLYIRALVPNLLKKFSRVLTHGEPTRTTWALVPTSTLQVLVPNRFVGPHPW